MWNFPSVLISSQSDLWFCLYLTLFPSCVSGMSVSLSLEIIISFAEVDVRYDVCEATREKVWISSSKKTTRGATTVDPSWMHNPIRGIREFHARIPKSQLHTRSYFADVHGWDLVSISQQNHRTIIQRHPDERRFYLCTGALTIHCSSSRYLFFFDDHEKECFWSCEVRTTWFVEQDAETFFENWEISHHDRTRRVIWVTS